MINVLTSHGWSFDHTFWGPWQQSIPFPAQFHFIERGYFFKEVSDPLQTNCRIILAHSFGLHFIPPSVVKKADLIVCLGCFYHFSWQSQLERMKRGFQEDPIKTLKMFYALCGNKDIGIPNEINRDLLFKDLNLLGESFVNQELISELTGKTILFHGTNDRVVPAYAAKELSEKIINSEFVLVDGANHLFNNEEMVECWKRVVKRLNLK